MGKDVKFPNNLKRLRVAAGLTQEAAAEAFGMSKSGYIKIEDGERKLGTDRIAKAVEIFKVDVNAIFQTGQAGDQPETSEPRVGLVPANRAFRFQKVIGTLQAGVFRDVEVFDDELDEMISTPPNTRYPWARQFVWRVEGDSMNAAKPKPINEGDYVVGLSYEDIQEAVKLRSGLRVVVRQTKDAGQSYEWTVKELELTDANAIFHPRSDNPKHKPIVVNRDLTADDGRKVEILAIVQYVYDNYEADI